MAETSKSFHEMVELLGASSAPLSSRLDVAYSASPEELQVARRAVGHVMADAEVRGRLPSFKVEPLVRAAAILLEDAKRAKASKRKLEVADAVTEYLDVLEKAFGPLPSLLNNRGLARALKGDATGADSDFAAARRVAPNFIAPRMNELALYRSKGDSARLEQVAAEILKGDPHNLEAMRALADAKVALNKPAEEVAVHLKQLHASKGACPSDLLRLALVAAQAGAAGEAEGFLREAVAAEPRSVEAHSALAASFVAQEKWPEAIGLYEKLTQIDGPRSEYLLAIAKVYDRMGRVGEAQKAFDFALDHASPRDEPAVDQAFKEFRARRGLGAELSGAAADTPAAAEPAVAAPTGAEPGVAEPAAPAPAELFEGPLPTEEPDIAEPTPAGQGAASGEGLEAGPPDFSTDAFEPKTIGESMLFLGSGKEIPIDEPEAPSEPAAPELAVPSPEPPAPQFPPPPPAEPKAPPAAAREESLADALESLAGGLEAADEIMGDSSVEERQVEAPVPPAPPAAARPAANDAVAEPSPDEAIVVAKTEAIVAEPAPQGQAAPKSVSPLVSAPPPRTEVAAPPAAPATSLAPVVSAPPPPPEPVDETVAAELQALASAESPPESAAQAEPEPFKRPGFDVDEFMAALEAKTKPVFDHLYDGMLEARRKDAAEAKTPSGTPQSAYESAPPPERPSVPMAPAAAAREPPAFPGAEASAPPGPSAPAAAAPASVAVAPAAMPALLHETAKEAILEAARDARAPNPGLLKEAQELAKAGKDAESESALETYLRDAPDDARAWTLKGELRERAGDEAGAIQCCLQAVKYDPASKEAWNNLGVLLHLAGRFEEAAGALEAAVKAAPDDRHLWHNLGSTYHELGRLEDALRAFDRAIAIDPRDKVSHNNKGTTLFEMGDFKGARACFERAAQIDPAFEQALNNLGRALEKLEDREGALHSFEAALALNAGSGTALKNLARVLRELGRSGEAAAAESRLRALGA